MKKKRVAVVTNKAHSKYGLDTGSEERQRTHTLKQEYLNTKQGNTRHQYNTVTESSEPVFTKHLILLLKVLRNSSKSF